MRKFVSQRAVRANVPLLIALIGPSGGGKTFSALRLATGIQRVQPGPIFGISTEGNRMLEYADRFTFQHVPFSAPFDSLDYLAAIQQCVSEGAKTIVVDSVSHEHEGPGGVLEQAEQYIDDRCRRANLKPDTKAWDDKANKLKRSAWIAPKAKRGKLIQGIVQLGVNVILCFRAKEGTDQGYEDGKSKVIKLGWVPIGANAFWHEMTARAMLLPGANGVPEWKDLLPGEKIAARRPVQFEKILRDGAQLSEDMGEAMARWASGTDSPAILSPVVSSGPGPEVAPNAAEAMRKINACDTEDALTTVRRQLGDFKWSDAQRKAIKATVDARAAHLKTTG